MKILLKKVLEKIVFAIFILIVIFGNILLVYNLRHKFCQINKIYDFSSKIDNSQYICIKNISNENTIEINSYENKQKLKELFDNIRVRKSNLKLIDKDQKIDYTIYMYIPEHQIFVNIKNSEIMIDDNVYETDININTYLEEKFEI